MRLRVNIWKDASENESRLPIEIRQFESGFLTRGVTSDAFDLNPGMYYVSARLPDGQQTHIPVNMTNDQAVVLPRPSDRITRVWNREGTGKEAESTVNGLRVRAYRVIVPMAFELVRGSGWLRRSPTPTGLGAELAITDPEVGLVQMFAAGRTPLNILLSPSASSGKHPRHVLVGAGSAWPPSLEVHTDSKNADLLLRYARHGYAAEAHTMASWLLKDYGRWHGVDAVTALYTMLRFGTTADLPSPTLVREHFRTEGADQWAADLACIYGECHARSGRHKDGLKELLAGVPQRLPVFSDGLSYTLQRLRLYTARLEGSPFSPEMVGEAGALLKRLEPYAWAADFPHNAFTSFTALDPARPEATAWTVPEGELAGETPVAQPSPAKTEKPDSPAPAFHSTAYLASAARDNRLAAATSRNPSTVSQVTGTTNRTRTGNERNTTTHTAARGETTEKVVFINRCAKVVKGGRRFSFSALIVAGDHDGKVGCGFGKANEVSEAIRKASDSARKAMVKVAVHQNTIPHEVIGQFGGGVRAVVEAAGIKDVLAKSLGSGNHANVVKATLEALGQLRLRGDVMKLRGLHPRHPHEAALQETGASGIQETGASGNR